MVFTFGGNGFFGYSSSAPADELTGAESELYSAVSEAVRTYDASVEDLEWVCNIREIEEVRKSTKAESFQPRRRSIYMILLHYIESSIQSSKL